jgi:quercetin dioxygenase-like cupin family protein
MLKQSLIGAALTIATAVGPLAAQEGPLVVQTPGIKRTPLEKVDVPGTNYEVVFGMAEFQPGVTVPSHTHPGPVLAYIAAGEFTLAIQGQPPKSFKAGESFTIPAGVRHIESMGPEGAKALAVYIVPKGQPLAAAAK